jgi:UDP-N-acetylmuramoylalanine--D-glutamate ligase
MNKLIILGGGESGVGAAILGKQQGWEVFLSDYGKIADKYKAVLSEHQIAFEEGKHSLEIIEQANLVIKSPGIPDKVPVMKRLKELNADIIDEIEFASRYTKAFIIGITGSNGKTTTTGLTYHLLEQAGLKVGVAGNIGISFAKRVAEEDNDYYVLEVSSFQLDYCDTFAPDISILINITPDHLDRYDYKMENYISSKFRIAANQRRTQRFLYNADDENITNTLATTSVEAKKVLVTVAYDENGFLKVGDNAYDTDKISIKGPHNHFNATCAILAAKAVGVADEDIRKGLATFKNAPHRLEYITTIDGVKYINDSKATNVDATFFALKAMVQPTIWIVGGVDKGNDYEVLQPLVKEKVKAMICLTKDTEKLITAFKDIVPIIKITEDVSQSAILAKELATNGDVVLMSSACASFDLFKNYMDRGEQFKNAVFSIAH